MIRVGIIGGSGLDDPDILENCEKIEAVITSYSIHYTKLYEKMSEIPALDKILVRLPFCTRLDNLIDRSGVNMLVGFFLLLSFSIGAFGALAAYLYIGGKIIVILPVSLIAALVPWFYILFMKKRRLQKFIALFPDIV